MIWSDSQPQSSLAVPLPPDYSLRTYQQGDEQRFFEIMDLVGWSGWDEEKLAPWLPRVLPDGWFFVDHKVSGELVAFCMALVSDTFPNSGELGWLACDPAHQGMGLGKVVSAAVTKRFLEENYATIHLYTEHYRLAAIKTYLRLGYIPLLSSPTMHEIWEIICTQLDWPYTPKEWKLNPDIIQG